MLRIYALTTWQGTAASETMLCEDDVRGVSPLRLVLERSEADVPDGATFIDVTDNDEAVCRWCGRHPYANTLGG